VKGLQAFEKFGLEVKLLRALKINIVPVFVSIVRWLGQWSLISFLNSSTLNRDMAKISGANLAIFAKIHKYFHKYIL